MQVINWKIATHPMNWVVIVLMLLIAGTGVHLLMEYLGHTPDTETATASAYTEQPAGQSPGQDAAGAIDPQGSLQGY